MKLNEKGFMLAEVVVVSVVIATTLVTLYVALNRLISAFDTRNTYYDIDSAYFAVEVNNILIENGEINTLINNGTHSLLTSDEIIDYKNFIIDELLFYNFSAFYTPYPKTKNEILSVKNIEGVSQTFKHYIDYLSGNIELNDEYNYAIISEICQTEDDCRYYTLKVR